jgi:hypothetical protein
MESNNGFVKNNKTTTPRKQQYQPIVEQKEKQVPISEILAKTKSEKFGLNKTPVSPDEIMSLLSGNRPQTQLPVIEEQYQNFIHETKQIKREINEEESFSIDDNKIRKMVTEEVTRILFKEIFSKNRLKAMMESVFKDVIKEKAKEILFETLQRRKAQEK